MPTCFVVATADNDAAAIYEYSAEHVSLVNNRHFRSPTATESDAIAVVKDHAPKFLSGKPITNIGKHDLDIGSYHPCIARPTYPSQRNGLVNPCFEQEIELIAKIKREIRVLSHDLEECFDVCSPYKENLGVFGTWYESTILFACIGIENLFVKVLKANGVTKRAYTMADFVKLAPHLKLAEYQARLAHYPWLQPFAPFANWNSSQPTQSLPWFFAYNKLKHDKLQSYDEGTMQNAINACLAYWIILHAVFGYAIDTRAWSSDDDDFYLVARPTWSWRQYYFESADGAWKANPVIL